MGGKEPSSGSLGTRSKATYLEDTPQQSCLRAGASVSCNFSLSLPCLKKMVNLSPLLKTSAFSVQASWMAVWRLGPLACPSPLSHSLPLCTGHHRVSNNFPRGQNQPSDFLRLPGSTEVPSIQ